VTTPPYRDWPGWVKDCCDDTYDNLRDQGVPKEEAIERSDKHALDHWRKVQWGIERRYQRPGPMHREPMVELAHDLLDGTLVRDVNEDLARIRGNELAAERKEKYRRRQERRR